MLADPQSVTINSIAVSLPRLTAGENKGSFGSNDGLTKETVSHSYGRRNRRMFRLDVSKTAPDPLISAQNIVHSMGVYLVVDAPATGYTVAEQKQVIDGLIAQLQASSGAIITKFLGGES